MKNKTEEEEAEIDEEEEEAIIFETSPAVPLLSIYIQTS